MSDQKTKPIDTAPPLTAADLAELRELVARLPDGPWFLLECGTVVRETPDGAAIVDRDGDPANVLGLPHYAVREFWARCRENVPRLLDMVATLTADLENRTEQVQVMYDEREGWREQFDAKIREVEAERDAAIASRDAARAEAERLRDDLARAWDVASAARW